MAHGQPGSQFVEKSCNTFTRKDHALNQNPGLAPPSHLGHPHRFTLECQMSSNPMEIYQAWTENFDSWFATPGAISMRPEVGLVWYFEVVHNGVRSPHYGRFLRLDAGQLVETTWLTGKGGTEGAETVVTVELGPVGLGTRLRLSHGGFDDQLAAQRHADSWPGILAHLDESSIIASSSDGVDP
jgi:uncharacterized protein YndB with AHSA1/START domain